MMKKILITTATILSMATIASAQTESAGRFNITANVGYVYNFANDGGWGDLFGKANRGVGFGARIGWISKGGFGLSADYLGWISKWENNSEVTSDYLGFSSNWKNDFDITNNSHVVTLTPSYRLSFGENKEWGLKLGMGVGVSLAQAQWAGQTANASTQGSRVAGGATYGALNNSNANGVFNVITTANQLLAGCGRTGFANSHFSDGVGGKGNGSVILGASQCETGNLATGASLVGLRDAEIAALFRSKQIVIGSAGNSATTRVSYGVWRRLFTETPNYGQFFGTDADTYETRAQYITRCASAARACESLLTGTAPAGTQANAAAAAAAVDSNGAPAVNVTWPWPWPVGTAAPGGPAGSPEPVAVTGKTNDDARFVLAPELAIEYDNGLIHADINARYIYELFHIKYDRQTSITTERLQKPGPLAVFIGAGLGVNF